MSLFPAYKDSTQSENLNEKNIENSIWLHNSSFKISLNPPSTSTKEDKAIEETKSNKNGISDEYSQLRKKKKNKRRKSCSRESSSDASDKKNDKEMKSHGKKRKYSDRSRKDSSSENSENDESKDKEKSFQRKSDKRSSRNKKNNGRKHKDKKQKSKSKQKENDVNLEEKITFIDISKVEGEFKIDLKRNAEFLTVRKIFRPSVPYYHNKYYLNDIKHKPPKKKFKRYFQQIFEYEKSEDENLNVKLTKKSLDDEIKIDRNINFKGFKEEDDMSKMTAHFNKSLGENPSDIEMWIKYARYQDTIFQFEKTYKKGSHAKGLRVTAERKLAILDKALGANPNCEKLLRERLNVAVAVYPADELYTQLKILVEKEQENIILWQGLIESRQCSMSHCTAPKVLNLYTKCLSTLHKLRRSGKLDKSLLDEYILRMLYQCGLFLRQTGLIEQLWTLLKMYLQLNLSQSKFTLTSGFDEKQLIELEEVVLKSKLPIHELWLRIEKLRECCHWLPYIGQENCEDPQRLVFPEDVSELIHPIATSENSFRLIGTIFSLLKIPLLPSRHSTVKDFGLDYVPWALDSVETLLPVYFTLYPIDLHIDLLKHIQKLAVGPQYLKVFPCQEEYLEFLLGIMKDCSECLTGNEKLSVTIWWFRFMRLLLKLENLGYFKMTSNLKKRLKYDVKNCLKKEEFRNEAVLYQEYALIENESGNLNSAFNILQTVLEMHFEGKSLLVVENEKKGVFCSIIKNLVELQLTSTLSFELKEEQSMKYLVSLILGPQANVNLQSSKGPIDIMNEAFIKFKQAHALMLKNDFQKLNVWDHFLPDYLTDFTICFGWFIYLYKNPVECGAFIENTLEILDKKSLENSWRKEVLFEFYTAILFKYCTEVKGSGFFKLLDDVLYRGIEKYPNNVFLLTVLMKEQSLSCNLGQQWWKIKRLLLKTGHALPILFLLLISNQHMNSIEETWTDTFTGRKMEIGGGFKNRMLSLFKQITASGVCTRRCGLVWRLYLQFLHSHFDLKRCRDTYYVAVEELPWLKALYIDAAIYIPGELAQIQDLLQEKELRLHMTPEELDILRE